MVDNTSGTLPFALVGDPGDVVTLRALLEGAYGADTVGQFENVQLEYFEHPLYPNPSYWDPENPSYTKILQDGVPLELGRTITLSAQEALDTISFSAGNLIYGNVAISFQTGSGSVQRMMLQTLPAALGEPGSFDRVVTAQNIVDSARNLAETFNGVPNSNDCGQISAAVAAAAGAPLPFAHASTDPDQNVDGGYWRIIHNGSEDPVANWQSLLQAGDIVRLEWADGSSAHSFTVTSNFNTTGRMQVVDNVGERIHQHWVEYESKANPASITIYRIASDGLYLITGSAAAETLYGTERSDDLRGFAGDDTIIGGEGDDVIYGGLGADHMVGGLGNDVFFVDNAGDIVVEAADQGYDRVLTSTDYTLGAGQEIEALAVAGAEGKAAFTLVGNEIGQDIRGNAGNNVINGMGGADFLHGLAGNDMYFVDNAADGIFEVVGQGTDTLIASVSYVLAAGQSVENLKLAGTASLDLTGNAFDNKLSDNAGNNLLDGGAGNDRIFSGAGVDTLIGGAGNDSVVINRSGATANLRFDMKSTDGTTTLVGDGTTSTGIETLTLSGGSGSDSFTTLGGNDILNGGAGNDILNGGAGIDRLTGGAGDDALIVDNAGDLVFEAVGGGTDKLRASVSYVLQADQEIETLQLTDRASINLTGNAFGQSLIGNNGANVLDGQGGADVLLGRGGADTFAFSTALGSGNVDRISDFSGADTIRLDKGVFAALAPGQLAESAFKNLDARGADANDRILYKQSTGELFYDADGSGSEAAVKFAVLDNKAAITHADFLIA